MANILIGISGSIAAYKSILYIRELNKLGHSCRVILTKSAELFVTPQLIAGLGCKIYSDESLDLANPDDSLMHINLAKWAECFVIAPASANSLAKLAHGIADSLLTTVALAYGRQPIYLAPAMNREMWLHSITQANLQTLQQHNYRIWQPQSGIQACGDEGEGRMQEARQLLDNTLATLASPSLYNKSLLITLGATIEKIDPVRFISNYSSGKMGLAIIEQALQAGFKVIALCGKLNVSIPSHPQLTVIETFSAEKMLAAALSHAANSDAFIACAAVCDFRVDQINDQKLKKTPNSDELILRLVKNPDIVATVKKEFPTLFTVGFAAETEKLLQHAQDKLNRKNLDAIVANNVAGGQVFNQTDTQITIICKNGTHRSYPPENKLNAARHITELLKDHLCVK